MGKILVGVVFGVFVGAMVFEIINRKHPNLLRDVEDRARRSARKAIDAFEDGYQSPRKMRAAAAEPEPTQ